jgi:hypothetical protein
MAMHQRRLLIAAFVLGAALLCLRVPTVGASALGLADGTYTLTLDFLNNVFDTTGTITVGATGVTAFHANIPTDGSFDCDPCTPGVDSPDRVQPAGNGPDTVAFRMLSEPAASCSSCWLIVLLSSNHSSFPNGLVLQRSDDEPNAPGGTWSATTASVPEPGSLFLLLSGFAGLGFMRLVRKKK